MIHRYICVATIVWLMVRSELSWWDILAQVGCFYHHWDNVYNFKPGDFLMHFELFSILTSNLYWSWVNIMSLIWYRITKLSSKNLANSPPGEFNYIRWVTMFSYLLVWCKYKANIHRLNMSSVYFFMRNKYGKLSNKVIKRHTSSTEIFITLYYRAINNY